MPELNFAMKLAEVESRAKSNSHRLDEVEREQSAILKLATAVEVLANEQKHQTAAMEDTSGKVSKLDSKVEALEQAPARRWESAVTTVVATLLAALVGYLLAQLGIN